MLLAGSGHVVLAAPQHRFAQVDARDVRVGPRRQLQRDPGRAGGHVQHRPWRPLGDVVDHFSAPPAVLGERQHRGEAVIVQWQPGEQGASGEVGFAADPSVHAVSSDDNAA